MKKYVNIKIGPNWIKIPSGLFLRLHGKCEYLVADIEQSEGNYFLDRFFIRHKVHIEYPGGDIIYRHPDLPKFLLYRIRFKACDESKVEAAMLEMYEQSSLMAFSQDYQKGLKKFQDDLAPLIALSE